MENLFGNEYLQFGRLYGKEFAVHQNKYIVFQIRFVDFSNYVDYPKI